MASVEDDAQQPNTDQPQQFVFHFAFVSGGRLAAIGDTELTPTDFTNGLPVEGLVEKPPGLDEDNNLDQDFLLVDADLNGALVTGRMNFDATGRANFQVTDKANNLTQPVYKTPITVYGNLLETTRGETVFDEVLGSGDPRVARQQFLLRKKPLTYIPAENIEGRVTTLQIQVDGVLWREVRTFFGKGPQDQVYTVRHDDEQETLVTFGDGVRGARLPSGVDNVIATYRFGSGKAVPPPGSIQQLARSVLGLRSVRQPIAAVPGQDPEGVETLRTAAPRSVLLFGRAVSTQDFATLAELSAGVTRASAEYGWIDSASRAGVTVTYIGERDPADLLGHLRTQAEEGLTIATIRAVNIPVKLEIGIAVQRDFDPELVAAQVSEALLAGPLSVEVAEIGGQFWPSRVYKMAQAIDGVVAVRSARLVAAIPRQQFNASLNGFALSNSARDELEDNYRQRLEKPGVDLSLIDVECVPRLAYFDFADRVEVDAIVAEED